MPDDAGMRRCPTFVPVAWLAAAGAFAGAAIGAPAASAALSGPEQIAFLNQQRAQHGIPADVAEVATWSAACAKHMAYLKATGKFQHHEDNTDPEYSDEGHWGGMHSVLVSGGDAFLAGGVNSFEYAPIHLMQMLAPYITRSGASSGCLVTQGDGDPLGGGASSERAFASPQAYTYPGNGTTGWRTAEGSYEFPFVPAAVVGLNDAGDVTRSSTTGPHLYFFYAGPVAAWNARGTITSASLTSAAGTPVEVRTVDNASTKPPGVGGSDLGNLLAPGGIVIPVKPLSPGTTYTASVTFAPRVGAPIARSWSFTTAGTAPVIGGGNGAGSGAGGSSGGGTSGTGSTATVPTVTRLKLKTRSVAFEASGGGALWVTVERQTRKKQGKKPAKYAARRSSAVTAAAGANRLVLKKLSKGNYRVRVRQASATGKILAEKTITL